eukprot:TRINITY_DN8760_c0_g2_i1.p1 TRINITY_DN8760_c0_g2~~TRINITY_DN8760_c0_g2_i1.p1  ORF type:complete len:546 (+),score=105.45 TRINITY_DN8760_c0_g2_i1:1255-2892(+)
MSLASTLRSNATRQTATEGTAAKSTTPFLFACNRTLDDGAFCYVGLAPVEGALSEPFAVSGKRFQVKYMHRKTVTMKLLCLDASAKAEVYAQCRLGVMSFTSEKRASELLHCLFTNSAPWGRTISVIASQELTDTANGYVALRGIDPSQLVKCIKIELVIKVLQKSVVGDYTIRPLPVVSHPAPAADMKDALEGGAWTYNMATMEEREGEENNPEGKGKTLHVTVPTWRYHNAVWNKGIPHTGEPRVWEVQVSVTHEADAVFGSLRVGVIPLDRYVAEGMSILDVSASINQEGTCSVTGSAMVRGECLQSNTATITVRVDKVQNVVSWNVQCGETDEIISDRIPLSRELLLSDLHPFVSLNYRGDTVTWLRGGVVPGDEEQMALDVKKQAEQIFLFCDRNDSGVLESEEVTFLVERTGREALKQLEGFPIGQVVEWYEAHGNAASDHSAVQLRRLDTADNELKLKDAFVDKQQWATAEVETLPEAVPMRKRLPVSNTEDAEQEPQYKTRAEFNEAGLSDEWFNAEAEPVSEREAEPEVAEVATGS